MNEYTYSVIVDDRVIASGMALENALILAKALFEEWYLESGLKVTIQRDVIERCTVLDEAVTYE